MRLGVITFFYADSGQDLIDSCIELALVFRCDPYVMFERPEGEINEVRRRTAILLKRMQADE